MNVPVFSPARSNSLRAPGGPRPGQAETRRFSRSLREPGELGRGPKRRVGSRCLNADVKALDKLQSVRSWNSSCCGEMQVVSRLGQVPGHFEFHFDECAVDEQY